MTRNGYLFAANRVIPTEIRKEALDLQEKLEFDDSGGEGVKSSIDDEYRWVGVEDPKIVVTTSRDPSSKLKEFAKVIYSISMTVTLQYSVPYKILRT